MSCERLQIAYQFTLLAPPIRRTLLIRMLEWYRYVGAVCNPSEDDDTEDVMAIF